MTDTESLNAEDKLIIFARVSSWSKPNFADINTMSLLSSHPLVIILLSYSSSVEGYQ
jgi:hypothetical protein